MSELHIRLGKALKLERQNKNLQLSNLADLLKTSESTLERLEEGDFSSFASPVYFSLYAKSYAESLGVDYARTMDAIREDLGESLEPIAPASEGKPAAVVEIPAEPLASNGTRKFLWIGIIAVITIALIVVVWMLLDNGPKNPEPAKVIPPVQTFGTQSGDNSASVPSDTLVITLSLSARGSSWVALMTDGDTALFRTFSAGETLEVSAVRQMILTVGTPSQIDLKINGFSAKLADRSGRISNVVITPGNIRAFTGGMDKESVLTTADSSAVPPAGQGQVETRESGR
jgi:transcriptional regulator with XRE-family HTH domain